MSSPILGIDLGTTHSLVGVVDSGFPILLADAEGQLGRLLAQRELGQHQQAAAGVATGAVRTTALIGSMQMHILYRVACLRHAAIPGLRVG